MSSGNREDYLINILRLTEGEGVVRTSKLASYMGVSPASVTEMLNTLSESGYVHYEKYKGVYLTEEGIEYAKNIRRKHHIVERFLTDVLDLDHEVAHEEACRIEHSISDDSANKICRMMGTKKDGDCSTCTNSCGSEASLTVLSDVSSGETVVISHLKSDDSAKIKRLLSMGFVPGREVTMESKQNNGPKVVKIGNSVVALDEEMADTIFIEGIADA